MRPLALMLAPLAFMAISGCSQLIAYIDRPGSSPAPSIPLGIAAALPACSVEGQVLGPTGEDAAAARVQNWRAVSGLVLRAHGLTGAELGGVTADASGHFRPSERAIQARTFFLEGSLPRGGQTWTYRAVVRLSESACANPADADARLRVTPATTALSLALEAGWRQSGAWVLPDDLPRAVAIIESLMAPPRAPEALVSPAIGGVEMLRAMIRENPALKKALLPFVLPEARQSGANGAVGAPGGGAPPGGGGGAGGSDPPLSGVVR